MRILIVTPAPPGSRKGNRITALKWRRMLRTLGHRVSVREEFDGQACDVLVALHARRSAKSIRQFRKVYPDRPLIVALTGTDLYSDIHRSSSAVRSLELASHLVVFHELARGDLPKRFRTKAHAILQSASGPKVVPPPLSRRFEVAVIGHLRVVKDPFRAAQAARGLGSESRIAICHFGAALSPSMEKRAKQEMRRNGRYHWYGDIPHWKVKQRLARSRLLVISSLIEGSSNVLSEAIACSVPVMATAISGNMGLLGRDYPGLFNVGDTKTLIQLLQRCEFDKDFYGELKKCVRALRRLVSYDHEREAWRQLLAGVSTIHS